MQITCSKCNTTKPHTDYHQNRSRSTGRQSQCKACAYKPVVVRKITPFDYSALCVDCGVNTRSQRYTVCLPCYNARRRSKYVSIKRVLTTQELEQRKQQRLAKDRASYHRRRSANPELFKVRERHKQQRRRRQDPLYKLRSNIGTLIANAIANQGYKKTARTAQILGCSFNEFYIHIQNQFIQGMSWNNRQQWHIDHIVPVSFAQTEQELIMLNHYTNLRPFWSNDNQNKSSKLTEHSLAHHLYKTIIELRNGS